MIKCKEGLSVDLLEVPNGHILTWGRSGQGKTFFLYRLIEEKCKQGKKVLTIDFSGSFKEEELQRKNFSMGNDMYRFKGGISWYVRLREEKDFKKAVSETFSKALKCKSFMQITLLEKVIEEILDTKREITMADLYDALLEYFNEKKEDNSADVMKNIDYLVRRLYPYRNITGFKIKKYEDKTRTVKSDFVLIDLTGYSEKERQLLTEIQLMLLWHELNHNDYERRCDVVVIDEVQYVSIEDGDVLSSMLREGRKKGLNVIMSTQFISHYERAELLNLQQAANMIIFRPAESDCKATANIICSKNSNEWQGILESLQIGEAVLKGNYSIEGRRKKLDRPLMVSIH